MLGFWLLVILAILLIALIPTWPYSRGWGYYPAGFLAVLLLLWLLLIWFGYVALWYPGRPVVVETPAVIEGTPSSSRASRPPVGGRGAAGGGGTEPA